MDAAWAIQDTAPDKTERDAKGRKTGDTVLETRGVSMRFGGIMALTDVDLTVREGEITALIGPNGAGKTTLFNCVTSIYRPTAGEVALYQPRKHGAGQRKEQKLSRRKPHETTALGMARTFQNIRLFPGMTVLENVMVARHCRTECGVLGALLRTPKVRREEEETVERSYQLLKYLNLHSHYAEEARNLAYGQQRRLEIARALATEPFMLLLDEPAAGMNPQETIELKELIWNIRDEFKLSVLLIEHDMNMVMSLSDWVYVMEYGCVIASGTPQAVANNPQVIKAYLGEEFTG